MVNRRTYRGRNERSIGDVYGMVRRAGWGREILFVSHQKGGKLVDLSLINLDAVADMEAEA